MADQPTQEPQDIHPDELDTMGRGEETDEE